MGARGPAPKPTALKRLQGNPGGRKLNDSEPTPAGGGQLRAPRDLGAAGKREWKRLQRVLAPVGLLTDADATLLKMYCTAFQRWGEAEAKVQQFGAVVTTKAGNLIPNPYLSVANRAMEQMLTYSRELGMTPSARSRMQVVASEPPRSLAEELFTLSGAAAPAASQGRLP